MVRKSKSATQKAPQIRAMTTVDLPAVLAVETRVFPVDAWPADCFEDFLETPGAYATCAFVDGEFAGYGLAEPMRNDRFHIASVTSVETMRGRGIGRALANDMIDEARRRGIGRVTLEVRPDNLAAIGLYQSLGFTFVRTKRRYYLDKQDALYFQLRLGK